MDKMSQFNFKEKNEKIVMSFIASIALISTLNAADFYATVDGDKITKDDINVLLQDPRVDFDKLPQEAKSQILEGAINRKLIAKKAIDDGIEKDPQYKEAIAKIKEDLALQVWQKMRLIKSNLVIQKKSFLWYKQIKIQYSRDIWSISYFSK